MANKLDEMKPRLAELSNERPQLDAAIEEMIRAVVKKLKAVRTKRNVVGIGADRSCRRRDHGSRQQKKD
jgi:hypothetical protein